MSSSNDSEIEQFINEDHARRAKYTSYAVKQQPAEKGEVKE